MEHTKKSARESLRAFVVIGIILGLAGGLVAQLAWPHEVAGFGGVDEKGSRFAFGLGMLALYVGSAMLFMGMMGWAVVLGREASPERTEQT